jgi:hypothetical protein
MRNLPAGIFAFLLCIGFSCTEKEKPISAALPTNTENRFSCTQHSILMDGIPFQIKGVVYVPFLPGQLPWELENVSNIPQTLKTRIDGDLEAIHSMGANTIRLWGPPAYVYEALQKRTDDMAIMQTLWIGSPGDLQDPAFKESTKAGFRTVIDRIYQFWPKRNPPILAYLAGNEISHESMSSTNSAHPEIHSYSGQYVRTSDNCTASEAFLAEMADYIKTYDKIKSGKIPLVSYANDIREPNLNTGFLDFQSENAYSYAVPFYRPQTKPGSVSGTQFQGWIEEVKARVPLKPLLITETGLSVSPMTGHVGPPAYGYGGNTETEQANGILSNLQDIETSAFPNAGVCIHEYQDAWWKYDAEDSKTHDPADIEEWFGLVKIQDNGSSVKVRPVYDRIKTRWAK